MSKVAERLDYLSPEEQRAQLAQLLLEKAQKPKLALLSFTQERLWFLEQLNHDDNLGNMPTAVRLTGRLDVAALRKSLNDIVRRHEILRTTFAVIDGCPVQVIASFLALPLPLLDLQHSPEAEREAEARRLAAAEAQRPFDLAQGPLLRASLLRLSDKDHVMLLNVHHTISDGWSQSVLLRELVLLYEAIVNGQPSPLPELPIQFADFAAWQRQSLQTDALAEGLAYWKQQLAGPLPILELVVDRLHSTIQDLQTSRQTRTLARSLTEAIKTQSRREGVTLFMTLLAAFDTLLYRYSGQDDIIIGTPIANRNRVEVEGMIGPFFNTLVLRTDLSGNPTFLELLDRVRKVVLEAFAHKDIPFEKLVEELQPERDINRNPLFQVVFAFQDTPTITLELPGLRLSSFPFDLKVCTRDALGLAIQEAEENLVSILECKMGLLNLTVLERFQTLLESIVADPEQRLSDLMLLTEAERHQLLVEWNDTQANYPQDKCVHELFEGQVEWTPDTIAVIFEEKQLTYRELNRRANQLAHQLQALGVGPEVPVGICVERSLELVVGILGILKAGGAYVPLDPAYPKERLAFMLEDAQLPVLLAQERLTDELHEHRAEIVCLDAGWEVIAQQSQEKLVSGTTTDNLAYVIYTSGSTGRPKGAMNAHRGIVNRLSWMQETYHLTEADRVMQKTPSSFDVSVWEFFWPLLTGAQLVVARPGGHKDSAYLVKLIAEQQITTLHFVPSMLRAFLEEQELETCYCLKRVICSGEALPFEFQERFFARLDAQLHNLYGPTEAAIDVTFWACKRESKQWIVPLGRPIANTQIYLLDSHLNPIAVGIPGELYIGGVGVGRGYLSRPELTAEKFIPDPFSCQEGARLYKTGDLACYLPDGNIEFLGRLDSQVKIRGFRIELGEIEAVLDQHLAVREVVVLARQDVPEEKRLVAYVVSNQEEMPTTSELRSFLVAKLPDYMVPSAFVFLDALPLTPNGKIDRRALPVPDTLRAEYTQEEYVAPESLLEEKLAQIWTDILDVERIGIYDDFFDLGGHSLLAAQVIYRINKELQMNLSVDNLFEESTIAGLAIFIEEILMGELGE